jgi:type II secretory pathway pseudopilin PulG
MRPVSDRGYAMAALLVGMSVMAIMLSVALPVWRTAVQREREAELVFRGEQYAHAIELFSRRTGGYPPSLDVLVEGRYLRKLYTDPMAEEGEFEPVYLGQPLPGQAAAPAQPGRGGAGGGPIGAPLGTPLQGSPGQQGPIGAGPIVGVVSSNTAESLRLYNGRGRYSEWAFVAIVATADPGAPGGAQNPGLGPGARGAGPGVPGRGGRGTGVGLPGRGGRGDGGQGPGAGFPGRGFPGPGNPGGQGGGLQLPGGQQQGP